MREALKVLAVVVILFATSTAAITWMDDKPTSTVTILKYGCPVQCVLALGVFLKIHFRADEAPDYLYQRLGKYFDRGGFCFAFDTTEIDGVCYLEAYFQNRHEKRCTGRIALQPARGFFLTRAKIDMITIEVDCEPAAFGVTRIAIPVSAKLQGSRQSFEVGASVDYPDGKGRMLRFRDGEVLRANTNFGSSFRTALIAGALVFGSPAAVILMRPATTKLTLPTNVAEELPEGLEPETKTKWTLGDPPLAKEDLQ